VHSAVVDPAQLAAASDTAAEEGCTTAPFVVATTEDFEDSNSLSWPMESFIETLHCSRNLKAGSKRYSTSGEVAAVGQLQQGFVEVATQELQDCIGCIMIKASHYLQGLEGSAKAATTGSKPRSWSAAEACKTRLRLGRWGTD